MELVRHCSIKDCKKDLYHIPTRKGMCTAYNPPSYFGLKQKLGLDGMLEKHFRLKTTSEVKEELEIRFFATHPMPYAF